MDFAVIRKADGNVDYVRLVKCLKDVDGLRPVAVNVDGSAVHLAECLDLQVVSMHPMIALSCHISVHVFSDVLREVVTVLLDVVHAVLSNGAVHFLIAEYLIRNSSEKAAAVVHHVFDVVACKNGSIGTFDGTLLTGSHLPFLRIIFSNFLSLASHSSGVRLSPRWEYSSSELYPPPPAPSLFPETRKKTVVSINLRNI